MAQWDEVVFFLTRDLVACTIGMNVPHNTSLWDRRFCPSKQSGKCRRWSTIGNDNSLGQINLTPVLSLRLTMAHLLRRNLQFWRMTGSCTTTAGVCVRLPAFGRLHVYAETGPRMPLRPSRLGYPDVTVQARQPQPRFELLECLIVAILEAADPWRALAQLREKMCDACIASFVGQ
jgi:hypothetical protein